MLAWLRSLDTPETRRLALRVAVIASLQNAMLWGVEFDLGPIIAIGWLGAIGVGTWLSTGPGSGSRWAAFGWASGLTLVWPLCRYRASAGDDVVIGAAFAVVVSLVAALFVGVYSALGLERWVVNTKARQRNAYVIVLAQAAVSLLWRRSFLVSTLFLVAFIANWFWPEKPSPAGEPSAS
jgi:hypothetical protein